MFISNIKLRSPERSKMFFCLNQAPFTLWSICPKLRVGLSEPNLDHGWWPSTFPSIYIPFFSPFSFFGHTEWLMELWFPNQGWNPGPSQWERWVLTTEPRWNSLFLFFIPLSSSFIYLQHFSLLFLHLSSISLWPALTPLGTFQFSGPLRPQKSLQCWIGGGRGGVPNNSSCKPSS